MCLLVTKHSHEGTTEIKRNPREKQQNKKEKILRKRMRERMPGEKKVATKTKFIRSLSNSFERLQLGK